MTPTGRTLPVLLGALSLAVGCRKEAGGASGAAPSASPSAVAPEGPRPGGAVPESLAAVIASLDLRVEARRGLVSATDPVLGPHASVLAGHFPGGVPEVLAFQAVSIEPQRAAVLLSARAEPARPLMLLLDSGGGLVWSKAHPMGGVKPGAAEPVLLSAPGGHVCLTWCNPETSSIALRRWAEDGGAFADHEVLRADACDGLTALYWPHRGWLLAVASPGGATLQLVDLDGARRWGPDGVFSPWTFRAPARVSIALDTMESFLLFRLGRSGGEGSQEYVFASRWSSEGRALWPGPLSVKRLPVPVREPTARLVLTPAAEGGVTATLPAEATAEGRAVQVVVSSDGTVIRP